MVAEIQFIKIQENACDVVIIPFAQSDFEKLANDLPEKLFSYFKLQFKKYDDNQWPIVECSSDREGELCRTILVPVKKAESKNAVEVAGGGLFSYLKKQKIAAAKVHACDDQKFTTAFINGFYLRSYDFEKYKTKGDKDAPITLTVESDDKDAAEKAFAPMKTLSDAVMTARDFVNEPPNILYPQSYAEIITKELKGLPVKVTVLDEKKLEKMGAGAIMAVGKASERQPRLVILEYDGRQKKDKNDKPLALIGKGVTFDTGGYSLKPRNAMNTMKMDMGGSAAVVGAFKALAANGIKQHVVGAVALAENMIAGNGYRVDDVITSLSGQTIEVMNTDAEGRLCLADAMTYIQDKYDPKKIVDMATLTGACMAALGLKIAGVFTNNDDLQNEFWTLGDVSGDAFWPLPVNDDFDKQIDSQIADMANLGNNPYAGASTAAVFLQRFVTEDRPWAHLDIAGTAWQKEDSAICPKGATGFGVRALYHWVASQ